MKIKKTLAVLLSGLLCLALLVGCSMSPTTEGDSLSNSKPPTTDGELENEASSNPANNDSENTMQNISFETSDEDYYFDWSSQSYTTIELSKGSATISKSGIYELTGSLSEGSVTVDIDKSVDTGTVYLVLNNASINSSNATPINVVDAKKVTILLEPATVNTITQENVQTTDENFPSAAIFSKADTTITGSGTLNVTTKYNDGVASKDDLIITDGNININAIGDGIVGKDLLALENTTINITTGKDGLRSTNSTDVDKGNIVIASGSFIIDAANDAIQAEKALLIENGEFDLKSGNGYSGSIKTSSNLGGRGMQAAQATTTTTDSESKKAVKSGIEIVINGGTFNIGAYEDAIHSNGNVTIANGTLEIEAGDDAIHADDTVTINGGDINIKNSCEGIEGVLGITITNGKVDVVSSDDGINLSDRTGTITISGGEISIKAVGDCIDSNGNILMSGGKITLDTSATNGADSAFDYDGTMTHTGGTVVDQNGATIDPTVRTSPGGMGGGKGQGGMMPGGTKPTQP